MTGMPFFVYDKCDEIRVEENKILGDGELIAHAGIDECKKARTNDILIECSIYNHTYVRKHSSKLKIRNEKTSRYEKKIDKELPRKALGFLFELLSDVFETELVFSTDIKKEIPVIKKIKFDIFKANSLLGLKLTKDEAFNIFNKLNCVQEGDSIIIPSYRTDLNIFEDLIEELGRVIGYNNIKPIAPLLPINKFEARKEKRVEDYLLFNGMSQVMTYPLVPKSSMIKNGFETGLALINPQSSRQTNLRTSIYPQHLDLVKELKSKVSFFELGRTYSPEKEIFSLVFVDKSFKEATEFVYKLFLFFNNEIKFEKSVSDMAHPYKSLKYKDLDLFSLHPEKMTKNNLSKEIIFCSFSIKNLFNH